MDLVVFDKLGLAIVSAEIDFASDVGNKLDFLTFPDDVLGFDVVGSLDSVIDMISGNKLGLVPFSFDVEGFNWVGTFG